MREIKTHRVEGQDHSQAIAVHAKDERSNGGANHKYVIQEAESEYERVEVLEVAINFQKGAVKEVGVNGISTVSLLAILIDHLQGFQSGEFRNRENAIVITKLEEAMLWLHKRTRDRLERGVEGKQLK